MSGSDDRKDLDKKIEDELNQEQIKQAADVLSVFNEFTGSRRVASDRDFDVMFHQGLKGQHSERGEITTGILKNYKEQQFDRYTYRDKKRKVILNILLGVLIAIVACIISCFICSVAVQSYKLETIVSTFVTLFGSLVTVLIIIVKYVFPTNEDTDFNELVTNIIKNDAEVIKSENEYAIKMFENKEWFIN